jgi:hypothetical protein
MAINVTGPGRFRPLVLAQRIGVLVRLGDRVPGSNDTWIEDEQATSVSRDPDRPVVVFDDEDVLIDGVYRGGAVRVFGRWISGVRATVEARTGDGAWIETATMTRTATAGGVALSARFRLGPGTTAFRVRVVEGFLRAVEVYETAPWLVRVRAAPAVLTFIAMGGAGSGGSSGTGSGSSGSSSGGSGSSSGGDDAAASREELLARERIVVDESRCDVDPTLVAELVTAQNIGCKDLCADCLNFVAYLGRRLLDEEALADHMHALRHKTAPEQDDFCAESDNPNGIRNRIVLGKWENSEHEPFRPPDITTFESILDEYEESGGGAVIIVANSLAGAKLAATVKDHWRWGGSVTVPLFVSWDATDLGGGVTSLGPVPQRVVNFFQRTPNVWFQKGKPIAEADVEFDLTGCLNHNAIVRSAFVQDRTRDEVRDALARVRALARDR